jgi:hypothetical protein
LPSVQAVHKKEEERDELGAIYTKYRAIPDEKINESASDRTAVLNLPTPPHRHDE